MKGFYFICGVKRSATHFLNRLFDGHPELGNTVNESYMFEYYMGEGRQLEGPIIEWVRKAPVLEVYDNILRRQLLPAFKEKNIYDNAFKETSSYLMDFDYHAFCDLLEKKRPTISSIEGLVRVWIEILGEFAPWNRMPERKNWIFKCADFGVTMQGAHALNLLDSAVFLVRNPFEIVNSIKKRREYEKNRSFHVFEILSICRALENTKAILDGLKGRCLLVRYEDLLKDRERVLEDICDYWGVSAHRCLKTPTLFGAPWQINTSFMNGREREDILSECEKEIVAENTRNYRKEFGYDI